MGKNIINSILVVLAYVRSVLGMTAFADSVAPYGVNGSSSTAYTSENGGVVLTNAIRMIYSREIEYKALPNMRFDQFATFKTELGVQPGDTISMLSYDNLKLGGRLTENVPIQTQALSGSMKQIKVFEHGNAVSYTEILFQTAFDNVMTAATTALGRDYAVVRDTILRDTALSGTNVVFARDASGNKVSGRTALKEDCTIKVSTIKDAIEILATNDAPKRDGYWTCFVHPHQSRSLRDDPAWINASNYGAPDQLFNGEIGRIDDTRFIETTILCNGAAAANSYGYKESLKKGVDGNQVDVYQACLFGDDYYGLATALPVELRDNGVEDFGRKHSLAWYAIFGSGILNNDYGVVIETA